MTRRQHSVSSWRLLLRALSYHRGQTIAVALVTALITAGAVFAPWYTQMVDDTVTQRRVRGGRARAPLSGSPGPTTPQLREMLPAGTDELFEEPVAGRHADLLWQSTNHDRPVEGGLIWRQDICDHIELVEGSCPEPPSTDDKAVPAAVSEADAEMYDVSVGDVLPEVSSAYNAVDFEVTGIYRRPGPHATRTGSTCSRPGARATAAPTWTSRWPTCSWSRSRAWCSAPSARRPTPMSTRTRR